MIEAFKSILEKGKLRISLLLTVAIFSLLRIPSLIEPDWYGDEGIYQVLGMAIRQGRLLYRDIWDNKPPILYLLYSIFNGDLFSIRLLSLIFGILAIIFLYYLSFKLLKKKMSVFLSMIFFAVFFGLPIIEGNIANAENFMLAPIILAALLLFIGIQKKLSKYFLFSGLLLSFAFLTKIVAIFDFAAFLIFILVTRFYSNLSLRHIKEEMSLSMRKGIVREFRNEIIFILAFIFPIILSAIFFLLNGAIADYIKAAFSQNVGYVGYGNYFLFPMGKLVFKLVGLILILLLIIKFRKKIGLSGVFIFIWILFSAFNALFSERPYTHYVLVLLPSLALFVGYMFEDKNRALFTFPVFLVLLFVITQNFHINEKVTLYYKNYLDFVMGKKNINSYQTFFDRNTPRDYDIANFIKANTKENESVFLWGDSAQIYSLSNKLPPGRYTVSYHITFYKNAIIETDQAINNKKPKYIIVIKDSAEINYLIYYPYTLKYNIGNVKIYEKSV